MWLYKTIAVFRTNREENAKSIVQLQNTKLEDKLSRKGGVKSVERVGHVMIMWYIN